MPGSIRDDDEDIPAVPGGFFSPRRGGGSSAAPPPVPPVHTVQTPPQPPATFPPGQPPDVQHPPATIPQLDPADPSPAVPSNAITPIPPEINLNDIAVPTSDLPASQPGVDFPVLASPAVVVTTSEPPALPLPVPEPSPPSPPQELGPVPEPEPTPLAAADTAFEHFLETGDIEEADKAIDYYKDLFEENGDNLAQPEIPNAEKVHIAGKLSTVLTQRFEYLGDVDDMEQAVEIQTKAAALALTDPLNQALQTESIMGLGRVLASQFEHTGDVVDAELAMENLNRALENIPEDSPARPAVLGDCAKAHLARYQHFDSEADLNTALDSCQEAIDALPLHAPERAPLANVYGKALLARFERSQNPDDIDSAVMHLSAAANQTSTASPERPKRLSHYGDALLARFQVQKDEADLQEAIETQTQALGLLNPESITLPAVSGSLASAYHTRYKHLGRNIQDLNEGIEHFKTAVELTPFSSPEYARVTDQLARAFISKYRVAPNVDLLDHAIMLHRQAVALTPENSRYRLERVKHLGYAFSRRFRSHHGPQRPDDRNGAISAFTEALNIIGRDANHVDYNFIVSELARIGHTVS